MGLIGRSFVAESHQQAEPLHLNDLLPPLHFFLPSISRPSFMSRPFLFLLCSPGPSIPFHLRAFPSFQLLSFPRLDFIFLFFCYINLFSFPCSIVLSSFFMGENRTTGYYFILSGHSLPPHNYFILSIIISKLKKIQNTITFM